MAKNTKTVQREKILKDFLELLVTSASDYAIYSDKVAELDGASQDLLHALELGSNREVSDNMHHLVDIRRQRRYAKDMAELLKPLAEYYTENRNTLNKITQLVGALRTTQGRFDKRKYMPRVIKSLEVGIVRLSRKD